jgi:hypothetical protein
MKFNKVYEFPLKNTQGMVFTKNNVHAFDFVDDIRFGSKDEEANGIVALLNDPSEPLTVDIDLSTVVYLNDSYVYLENKPFLSIRGWGHLTSPGGLNLSIEEAVRMQDDFGKWLAASLEEAAPFGYKWSCCGDLVEDAPENGRCPSCKEHL